MKPNQLQMLIATLQGGSGRGAAGTAGAAVVVRPMGSCVLGKDNLKRPKK